MDVLDIPEANIIQHFNETFDYIDQAHKSGGCVLVHCQAGVSRSATVLAAYLMKAHSIEPSEAIARIRAQRPCVSPNSGFLHQLDLYHKLKYDVDPRHADYRRFLVISMAREQQDTGYITNLSSLAPDPETQRAGKALRCKKCRRVLALAEHMVDHQAGPGQQAFSYFKRDASINHSTVTDSATTTTGSTSSSSEVANAVPRAQPLNPLLASLSANANKCSSFFIEPMEWISGLNDGRVEGRIECPKCYCKLGQYNWSGAQCSCGRWIAPAFMLHQKQVDQVNMTRR